MTPEQIAAMIADRESGTPGSWKVKFRKDGSAYMSIGGDRPGDARSKFSIGLDSQYPSDVTNARRISRVPDMEATIIAQAAELSQLKADYEDAFARGVAHGQQAMPEGTFEVVDSAELAALRAERDALRSAVEALGAMPEGYCFCSKDRIGDDSKSHEPECADLRSALAKIGGAA